MPFDITFRTSFNCLVAGASGTGKTTWVRNLLKLRNHIFSTPPVNVIWFYAKHQPMYDEMKRDGLIDHLINANSNFPTSDSITEAVSKYKDKGGSLIVFDDILADITSDFVKMFCNTSHHENASMIFLTQNLMYQNKHFRTMSLNCHYIVLMRNERAIQQVSFLSRQICPDNIPYIIQAYSAATRSKPYSYLVVDLRSDCKPQVRLRSNIFPHEFPTRVFKELPLTRWRELLSQFWKVLKIWVLPT
jgi:ABC-type proline/glycine betaine transport system ATPase subunit